MAGNRVVLRGSQRDFPPGAEATGPPDPQQQIKVTIVLRRRAPLPEFASGDYISREEFARRYGADPANVAKVKQFAESAGLRVEDVHLGRRSVTLTGTVADMTRAFEANLQLARVNSLECRVRTGTLTLPAHLDGIIEGVFGFDTRPQARTHFRRQPSIRPRAEGEVSYAPPAVAQLYQFPGGTTGAGQTIGIIELGGGYTSSDLTTFFAALNIAVPSVTSVSVDGGANAPSGDPNSADGEVALDIEVAGSIAPAASIVVYFTTNTSQGFLDAITTAIHDQSHAVSVISISWGGPESTWTSQAMQSYDQAFQDAAALGVTVCVAAGDNGSSDGVTDGSAHVDFPASSPNVLACGGTSLEGRTAPSGRGSGRSGTSGGAQWRREPEFPLPSYRTGSGVPVSVDSFTSGGWSCK